ncbi:helix-turn-helix transcriptional regulator [Streptomyces goshikiensis]|uniref:helix-turn-helix transcriptional regulator n=1 Tax=Streptomyces goshikiensis TaxID=1942 RepID=UPI0036CDE007
MTVTQIADEHGVSRQTIHTYRRRGIFPQPVTGQGSTRPRFREDEVAEFFAAHPKQPGKRTDRPGRTSRQPEGELAVSDYILTMRIVLADEDLSPEEIRNHVYAAGEELPFAFDITGVEPAE